MSSTRTITNYFTSNYKWCVRVIQFGRIKDTGYITEEDAKDLLEDTIEYFLKSPDKFDINYVTNKLLQKRKNFFRDRHRESEAINNLKGKVVTDFLEEGEGDPYYEVEKEEEISLIEDEIRRVIKDSHREILIKNLLEGVPIVEIESPLNKRMRFYVVQKFISDMREKYGGL